MTVSYWRDLDSIAAWKRHADHLMAQRMGRVLKLLDGKLVSTAGPSAAIAAGIDFATGQVVVCMDADLQNDPADIPRLLAKLAEGYDLVSGWRQKRRSVVRPASTPPMLVSDHGLCEDEATLSRSLHIGANSVLIS